MNIPFKPDLTDKVCVITGGGGVLCSVFARALAGCGASVVLIGRTLSTLNRTVGLIRGEGGEALPIAADVTDPESLKRAHEAISDACGPCDILINGAGGNNPAATTDREYYEPSDSPGKSFFDLAPEAVNGVFGLNFTGTLLTTQVFAADMAAKQSGVIINISSMNAYRPLTKIPAYSAAKAAVSNFTQWLAVYFSKCGIRVNALAPGFFVTDQNRALLFNESGAPTARTGRILASTPMGRFGEPEELVGALLFLIDDRCSGFVTGVTLPVDGGFAAYSGV